MKKSKYKHGQWFRANIDNVDCIGRVSVTESGIHLCQNEITGSVIPDRLGFLYSWYVLEGTKDDLKEEHVKNLVLLSRKPKSFKMPIILPDVGDYSAIITNGGEAIKVGCTKISRELYLEIGRLVNWIE